MSVMRTRTALLLAFLAVPLSTGKAAAQNVTVLDAITVEAESDDILVQEGYVPIAGRIGSKTDTPLVEVPQSISVVTERQLDDRNPRTVLEALSYTPGAVVGAYGFDPRFDAFFVRGFALTYNGVFRDGLRQYASPTGLFRTEPYGLEGISILKGPSSTLYGASSAGGLINLMTKRPKDTPFREVEVQVGSHDRLQGNFDLSGPVTGDGVLLYRMTGVLRDSGTEIEGFPDDRAYIAPAFTWKPDEDTHLTVLGGYMDSTVGGTAIFYNDPNGNITDIYGGDPRYNDFTQQQYRIGYDFEHRFGETFTVRSNARFAGLQNDLEYAYVVDPTTDPVSRAAGRNAEELSTFVIDNHVESRFATGAVDHVLLTGIDYGWITYDQSQGFGSLPGEGPTPTLSFTESQEMQQTGVYASDQLRYGNWIVNLGARYDWLNGETITPNTAGGRTTVEQRDEAFSGRAGLSYRTPWGFVPYVSYSTAFTPNVGTLMDGSPAEPTTAQQKEIGVKYEVPAYNALITAALFDIEQEDGVVFDASSGVNEQVQLDLRSRGFEIEAVASLDNGLSFQASYAYTDLEIVQGAQGTTGNTLTGIPYHSFAFYGDYTFLDGPAAGLGFGAGVRYVGESFGNDLNTTLNEDRFYIDAALHYDFGARNPKLEGLRLQVNATNLLDEKKVTCTSGYCYRDEGRQIIGSLRFRW